MKNKRNCPLAAAAAVLFLGGAALWAEAAEREVLTAEGDGVLMVEAEVLLPEQGLEGVKRLEAIHQERQDEEELYTLLIPENGKESWQEMENGGMAYRDEAHSAELYGGLTYRTSRYERNSFYGPQIIEGFPAIRFEEDKDLSFLSVKEAKTQALSYLEALGIEEVEIKTVYSADKESLASMMEAKKEEGNPSPDGREPDISWKDEDEYYLIEAVKTIDGVPLKEFSYLTKELRTIPGGKVEIAVGKEGIQYVNEEGTYEVLAEEELELKSAEELLPYVRKSVEEKERGCEARIEEMSLVYYPVLISAEKKTCILEPAWQVKLQWDDEYGTKMTSYFEAETGAELRA